MQSVLSWFDINTSAYLWQEMQGCVYSIVSSTPPQGTSPCPLIATPQHDESQFFVCRVWKVLTHHMGAYCWLWGLIHIPLKQSNYVDQGKEIVVKVGSFAKKQMMAIMCTVGNTAIICQDSEASHLESHLKRVRVRLQQNWTHMVYLQVILDSIFPHNPTTDFFYIEKMQPKNGNWLYSSQKNYVISLNQPKYINVCHHPSS